MNSKELRQYLKTKIVEKLIPLIDGDYVYWDLPYHVNIGDTLIWQGTLDFLRVLPFKMLDYGNTLTADESKLNKSSIILLHGGGNFGDIYDSSQRFRKKIVQKYPDNKIIVLPQTIYYKNINNEIEDFKVFSQHKNFYLCVRDHISLGIAKKYLSEDNILLLPDMAFCMDEKYILNSKNGHNKKLLIDRVDIEKTDLNLNSKIAISDYDKISDWPTFEHEPAFCAVLRYIIGIQMKITGRSNILSFIADFYANNYVRNKLVKEGVNFIKEYDEVHTTRLHGCILAVLLGKKIYLLDNSYGKNKAFYDAWLTDYDLIKI